MAKRSAGAGSWLIVGAVVLIFVVPKEVWIGLGILLVAAGAAYVAVKLLGARSKPVRPEPTLAELMASAPKTDKQSYRRGAARAEAAARGGPSSVGLGAAREMLGQGPRKDADGIRDNLPSTTHATHASAATPATAAAPNPAASSGDGANQSSLHKLPSPVDDQRHEVLGAQPTSWEAEREAFAETIRKRSRYLREKFPPTEQVAQPADDAPVTIVAGSRTRADADTETASPRDSGEMAVERAMADSHPNTWESDRQKVAETNRERANYLREKYPDAPEPDIRPRPAVRMPIPEAERPSILATKAAETAEAQQSAAEPQPAPAASASNDVPPAEPPVVERTLGDFMRLLRGEPKEERFFAAHLSEPQRTSPTHALPPAPAGVTATRWVKAGETVEIAGLVLPGGMLYVGPRLAALNGNDEPALINPRLRVAAHGDYRLPHTNYWPSYAGITPQARRAYLQWLAEGRSHTECDIGLVFLFFYGLERRILIDSKNDEDSREEWPSILTEIRRLLKIYGDRSGSFRRFASELLSWMELDGASSKLYDVPVPDFPRTYELPPYLRLALGQASVDRQPLPPALALAWVRLCPEIRLRSAATRCPEEFAQLFVQRYREVFGAGLLLPKNRTKLQFVYQPASSGLRGAKIKMDFGDVPDVTVLTAPIKKLGEIADQCNTELGPYSRMVGKDPTAVRGLETALLLPGSLWPEEMRAKLRSLLARMRDGRLALPLGELLFALGGMKPPINRERVRSLARALEGADIGLEPHVLAGARVPGERDTVVLFAQAAIDSQVGSGAEYQTAALTLQLASAMANSEGDFNDQEVAHLRAEIEGWAHLTPAEQRRLHAHLQWLTNSPPTLAGMKKKLEPLPVVAREALAGFMITLAQSDGLVSPDEVKFLEKLYKALGVEPKRVFSDVHAISSGSGPVSVRQAEKEGFRLDADRLAALQADTAKVSALLSTIFTEEAPPPPEPTLTTPIEAEAEAHTSSPLRLDEPHSALVRLLLSRTEWSRAELEDASADLDLMLDGALEQINEAAFDAFDEPLCEGDDPLAVNIDLLEKLEA